MSTNPYGTTPPTTTAAVAYDVLDPHEHRWFAEPTRKVGPGFTTALFVAQLVFFVALLGPAIVGIAVKVDSIVPEAQRTSAVALVAGFGAAAAFVANVLFGRLSDRTTSRWGRRRPWIVGGTVVMTLAFVVMALGTTVPMVTLGWFLAQIGANAALAPFVATLADQVPRAQRGKIAAALGMAQNVGIYGGTLVAQFFQDQLLIMFVGPAVLAIVAMGVYAFVLPDQVLPTKPASMSLREWVTTFWVSPRRHPDFALAWWSRFLVILATFMFTTFRLFYMQDRIGLDAGDAVAAVSTGVLIYTVVLLAVSPVAGWISDRTGRRKVFVAGSTLIFAVGTLMLTQASTVGQFYAVEAVLGLAYGIYVGVDLALVVDVLPNPDDSGKDLGVFNMANAIPQTLAPALGGVLLAVNSATNQNYDLLLWVAGIASVIGALVVLPIKKVR
ncbi:MFS transporter [Cellulomonas fimi]|uniref:Major facilitator superfamily MFS_1 n=1 Tax=Cellulomonas fimi (strain ATCC 484 / DSM 20113 / JCM 1341 / CCUG 24087 / LMG 16345 / NBRC 15513 / NCIMB 8980 / NCTC 7547 / NRS-133) TaxID=590998 RepID=F4H2G5_CELFA|nr:MFS transporter [Cellulomonas fimi]AEE47585.1 major facilitator superfamily MFS_1 [Cellulomonas fimi ATCC 484]NNH08801.1 MFS transporter [Cellulomonas fimi]VEH36586.1 multidrug efflux system protein MdtL [Cellulomonas fimi]